ncbi:MAG: glycosyl transferase [Rhodospirillaceae bacterium]|nr:glycosyl transferase [Rhodospirillaceae bacterium]
MNVSAVIPTFNRGHCLLRAINSVLAQTTPVDEIIVVDDGSDDKTYDLLVKSELLDMRGQLPNIRYLYQENKGVSAARNLGIKEAENEYIALLDSDDAWAETKIERQALKLEKKNFSCRITHTEEIWLKDGQRINPKKKHKKSGGFIFEKCLPLCCISPSSVLLHRTLFDDYGFFDEKLPACEDYDMWLRLCAFEEVLFVEEALTIKYGGHADQLSRSFWGMDRFRVQALEKLINSGKLSKTQRSQALEMLVKKIEILLLGAKKREKKEMIKNLDMKLNYWLEMI